MHIGYNYIVHAVSNKKLPQGIKKKGGEGRNQNYQSHNGEHYYLVFFVCFFLIKLKRFPMAKI
jgi:hypothetical protein